MKKPVRVTITGAAGQISYSLIFRIASGSMLGPDQPVILQLLEITPALPALNGVVMELNDCAFPLVAGVIATDKLEEAFDKTDYALLVGARQGPLESLIAPDVCVVECNPPIPRGKGSRRALGAAERRRRRVRAARRRGGEPWRSGVGSRPCRPSP